MFDKTEMGSPYRILDQKTRAAKADKTYDTLATLSQAVGGIYQLRQQDHTKEMQRRAKNDLVNNTINPDLQLHERAYASTVAKGQALETFHDLKSRVATGEFDNSSPEDFQEYLSKVHEDKSREYSRAGTSAWNDFWVEQEATLTAGQAGRYRVALKGRSADELGKNLVTMYQQGTYTPEDMVNQVMSEDYSLLSTDDRRAMALQAGSLLASLGDDTLLHAFDEAFDFQSDYKYAELFHTAQKVAHRKQRMIHKEGVAEVYHSVKTSADNGALKWEDWEQDVTGGIGGPIPLKDALDENGNPIITAKEFSNLMRHSQGRFGSDRVATMIGEKIDSGIDVYGIPGVTDSLYQQAINDRVSKIMGDDGLDPNAKGAQIGQLLSKQTMQAKFTQNLGTTFANIDLTDPETHEAALQSFNFFEALEQGFNNKAKFIRQVGTDASARYKIMDHAGKFAIGSESEKALAGVQAAARAQDAASKGLIKKISTLPEGTVDEIDSATKKYLKENDKWYELGFGARRDLDLATSDFRYAAEVHYKWLRNNFGMTHEPALEEAIDATKSVSTLFDGSIVMTWGADFGFVDSNRNIVNTLKNDKTLMGILSKHYQAGETFDLQETPGLDAPATAIPKPDWDQIRFVPDANTRSVLALDRQDNILHAIPIEHVNILQELNNQNLIDMPDFVKKLGESAKDYGREEMRYAR